MTRDELDAATDEQLNVMAAKVMGWVRRTHNDVMGTTNADLEDDDYWRGKGDQLDELWWYKDTEGWWKIGGYAKEQYESAAWSPATDIADAWELVEKMRVLYGFNLDASGFDGAEWRVVIGWGDDPISVHVEAATAPRAITTAALLAWEAKEKA